MTFKVAQDAVDYGGIDDEGDDLHLGAASTEQRIRFVDAANQLWRDWFHPHTPKQK
jgi:hypothetical protein